MKGDGSQQQGRFSSGEPSPKKVLLHTCCGVCAYACLEKLIQEGFLPVAFFFNPNIHPRLEYRRRKKSAYLVARTLGVRIIEGNYAPAQWFKRFRAFKQEEEGGERCRLCYRLRLQATFDLSEDEGYDYFTTTLTVSPHKESLKIIKIGRDIGGDKFLPFDFKKNEGFKKSITAAKRLGLYRQNYCGCLYSLKKSENG